jgi:hypothetical protein
MSAADVFVSPADSIQESFGLTPVEAMASGVPQVVSDWDGYRDTVTHGETGFLIPTYWADCDRDLSDTGVLLNWMFDHLCLGESVAVDPRKMREHLQHLIESEDLRRKMSACSRDRALRFYSPSIIAKQYEELWAESAQRGRSIPHRCKPVHFDQPFYTRWFGHYATTFVSDNTELLLTPLGERVLDSDSFLPEYAPPLSDFKTLQEEILQHALRTVSARDTRCDRRAATPPGLCSVGDLVEMVANDCRAETISYVRRHVMWLIKYGCLEPVFRTTGWTDELHPCTAEEAQANKSGC